ncbi:hypothetical protein IID27_02775 [Patescibacteria group bacterium]|nr:hypothetical protein [Patescibacteria group bacterium]
MNKAATAEKQDQEMTLSCREAHLLLRTIPLDERLLEGKVPSEWRVAAQHYIQCDECRSKGMNKILGTSPMACKAALERWAGIAVHVSLSGGPMGGVRTIHQQLVIEHIFGRQNQSDWENSPSGYGRDFHNRLGMCESDACKKTFTFVRAYDNCSLGFGVREKYHGFLLELFYEKQWPLAGLLRSQRELLESLSNGEGRHLLRTTHHHLQYLILWWAYHGNGSHDTVSRRLIDRFQSNMLSDVRNTVFCCEKRCHCGGPPDDDCSVSCFLVNGSFFGWTEFIRNRRDGKPPLEEYADLFAPRPSMI